MHASEDPGCTCDHVHEVLNAAKLVNFTAGVLKEAAEAEACHWSDGEGEGGCYTMEL